MRRLECAAICGLAFCVLWASACGSSNGQPDGGSSLDGGMDAGVCAGSQGAIQVTAQGVVWTMDCLSAQYIASRSAQPVQFTADMSSPNVPGADINVGFLVDAGCTFDAGQVLPIAGGCLLIGFTGDFADGGFAEGVNVAPQGGIDYRQGSLTITNWSEADQGRVGVSFSANAQMSGDVNGSGDVIISLGGNASGLIDLVGP